MIFMQSLMNLSGQELGAFRHDLLLLILTQDIAHRRRLMLRSDQRLSSVLYGRFRGDLLWPDLGDPRGFSSQAAE